MQIGFLGSSLCTSCWWSLPPPRWWCWISQRDSSSGHIRSCSTPCSLMVATPTWIWIWLAIDIFSSSMTTLKIKILHNQQLERTIKRQNQKLTDPWVSQDMILIQLALMIRRMIQTLWLRSYNGVLTITTNYPKNIMRLCLIGTLQSI